MKETDAFPAVSLRSAGRYVEIGDSFKVAKLYAFDNRDDFARMFAASPELVKFAQDFLDAYRDEDGEVNMKWFANEAYTVLTKALGKPPF